MNIGKGIASLAVTMAVAAVVAYAVSAPRQIDQLMNEEQASLGGRSLNQETARLIDDVQKERCDRFRRIAEDAWNQAVEQGTTERDASRLDENKRQAERYCKE